MTATEFGQQIDRLKAKFGNRPYEGETVQLLWKRFTLVDLAIFTEAVNQMLLNERSAPMLPKFEEVITKLTEKKPAAPVRRIAKGYTCGLCVEGTVRVWDKAPPYYDTFLRCTCPAGAGAQLPAKTPTWNSGEYAKTHTTERPNSIFAKKEGA